MEEAVHPMTPFDEMVSDDNVQMLKAAIPYLSIPGQRFLSLYVKTAELLHTLTLFDGGVSAMEACHAAPSPSPEDMLNDIRKFCSGEARNRIDQVLQTITMIQMIDLFEQP